VKIFISLLLLKLALAIIFLPPSHNRIVTNNEATGVGNFFLDNIGFTLSGAFVAWPVIISQVAIAIWRLLNKCVRMASLINIIILIKGIILLHYREGWFVAGGGRNGVSGAVDLYPFDYFDESGKILSNT